MLTYYQAVELMSHLPILLSPVGRDENSYQANQDGNDDRATGNILEMPEPWYLFNRPVEANGQYFAD